MTKQDYKKHLMQILKQELTYHYGDTDTPILTPQGYRNLRNKIISLSENFLEEYKDAKKDNNR